MLEGYEGQILQGTISTIVLALSSLVVAFILGMATAVAKVFGNRFFKFLATIYTTLIRSVPDLVLMLLIFFGIQILLNSITDALGVNQINLDPFVTGVLTIGFVYGAFFGETFRGAFLAVPKGQYEAAKAYGLSQHRTMWHIMFPQMMRYALPGVGNNWLIVLKATALVSILGLQDLVLVTQEAGRATQKMFLFIFIAGAIYLLLTTISNVFLYWLERRYSAGIKEVDI
ncbi:ABC transporter, inner membrane subunit [Taylorella asinigenitalis 14/45]|uniref:Histidine ABC transporter, permease protein HisQ n=2 Tax=Taylorella asinigenitalis TaxID=84590 RepID=G4QD14_TAYAM|nr:ABC transporter permease [Taylorella asinigenitalis]AEP35831.1 Histidine ABC transporter, permease protein HisQ [Taylorella asinigenitalis MCE3]CCG19733.1 ABC transporter, inner membrane subunit [Taylorella asinigenitalis 14/45]